MYKPGDILCYQFNPPTEDKYYYVLLNPKKDSSMWYVWDVKFGYKTLAGTEMDDRTITKVS